MSCRSPRSVESSVRVQEECAVVDSASNETSAHSSLQVTTGGVVTDSAQLVLIGDWWESLPVGGMYVERQGNLTLQAERTAEGVKLTGTAPRQAPTTVTAESSGTSTWSRHNDIRHDGDAKATVTDRGPRWADGWWVLVTLGLQTAVAGLLCATALWRRKGGGDG